MKKLASITVYYLPLASERLRERLGDRWSFRCDQPGCFQLVEFCGRFAGDRAKVGEFSVAVGEKRDESGAVSGAKDFVIGTGNVWRGFNDFVKQKLRQVNKWGFMLMDVG